MQIDRDRLEIRPIKPNNDVSKLDCTEDDGSDPLGVQNYLTTKAVAYHEGRVSAVFIVKQDKRVLAFFTLSMTAIEKEELEKADKLGGFVYRTYPAVLLGQMGVDKQYRIQGLGQLICDFCVGLAATISEQIACRYIVLETSQDKVGYYNKKCGFKQSVRTNANGRVWMYRRLSLEVAGVINEKVGINESVTAVVTKADKE